MRSARKQALPRHFLPSDTQEQSHVMDGRHRSSNLFCHATRHELGGAAKCIVHVRDWQARGHKKVTSTSSDRFFSKPCLRMQSSQLAAAFDNITRALCNFSLGAPHPSLGRSQFSCVFCHAFVFCFVSIVCPLRIESGARCFKLQLAPQLVTAGHGRQEMAAHHTNGHAAR